jgi:prophage maintenance system killer protein
MKMMTDWDFNTVRYDPTAQNYVDAEAILHWIHESDEASPKDIAESRRRENVIRVQCRRLREAGLVTEVGYETYALTEDGARFLERSSEVEISSVAARQSTLDRNWRIRDFDELDPDVFKRLNEEEFFDDPENDYGLIENDREITRRRIQNVKDYRIDRVMREFPRSEPVPQQCAHWMRAIVGLHFFPDANHRTAMGTLSFLLDINGVPYSEWPGSDIERAVLKSKLIRLLFVDVRFDNLWEKDELYTHWHRYFRGLLCDVTNTLNRDYSVSELKEVLRHVREIKTKL